MRLSAQEAREHVLAEHDELRRSIESIRQAASTSAFCGDAQRYAPEWVLCTAVQEFIAALRAHIDREENMLAPILYAMDAWGPEREHRLREQHRLQRIELSHIELAFAPGVSPTASIRSRTDEFLVAILDDMRREELEWLTDDALRDEPNYDDVMTG